MITEQDINLLDWFDSQQESVGIIHCCNCFTTMGGGIAKQIKDRYPIAYEVDLKTGRGNKNKLGKFSIAEVTNSPTKLIYNLYGQYRYGRDTRYVSYDALCTGFSFIHEDAKLKNLTFLGIPKNIGCMLAGGSWGIVKSIIEEEFMLSNIKVNIRFYEPKQ